MGGCMCWMAGQETEQHHAHAKPLEQRYAVTLYTTVVVVVASLGTVQHLQRI